MAGPAARMAIAEPRKKEPPTYLPRVSIVKCPAVNPDLVIEMSPSLAIYT